MAQSVARRLGKAEVTGSSPANSCENPVHEGGRDFACVPTMALIENKKIYGLK